MSTIVNVPEVGAPRKLAYQFLDLARTDLIVFCFGIALAYTAARFYGFWGLIAVAAVTVFELRPRMNGRQYYVNTMDAYGRIWLDGVLEGKMWTADGARSDLKRWKRILARLFVAPDPFPFRVDKLFHIGLVYDVKKHTDSVIIEGRGSSFAGSRADTQGDMLSDIANEITTLAAYKGLRAKVSFKAGRRPSDLAEVDYQHASHLTPDAVLPEAFIPMRQRGLPVEGQTFDEALLMLHAEGVIDRDDVVAARRHQLALEAKRQVALQGRDVDLVAILTVRRSKRLQAAQKKLRKKGRKAGRFQRLLARLRIVKADAVDPRLTGDEAGLEDLVMIAERFSDLLIAERVTDVRILDIEGAEAYLRRSWDARKLGEYYELVDDGTAAGRYLPEEFVEVDDKFACFDGTYHATMRLTQLPKSVQPDDAGALFGEVQTESNFSFTVTSDVVTGSREYWGLGFLINVLENIRDVTGWLKTGPKSERKRTKLSEMQEKLDEQEHVNYFSVYLHLAGTDKAALVKDMKLVEQASRRFRSGVPDHVTGSAWVVRGALSASVAIAQI